MQHSKFNFKVKKISVKYLWYILNNIRNTQPGIFSLDCFERESTMFPVKLWYSNFYLNNQSSQQMLKNKSLSSAYSRASSWPWAQNSYCSVKGRLKPNFFLRNGSQVLLIPLLFNVKWEAIFLWRELRSLHYSKLACN